MCGEVVKLEARLSSVPQLLPNSEGIAPQMQNRINVNYVVFDFIIDAEWESLGEHPMKSSELDEHRQKELKSQDRKGLSRESSRQLQLRTIHRIMHQTRSLLRRPRVSLRSWLRAS